MEASPALEINPLTLFDIARSEGRPLYTAAPMVRYSKLAFRETVAQYGVDLCWTPMILAKEFNRSVGSRDSDFTTSPKSPPTIVQFGVSSPLEISRATTLIAPHVSGVDINCGCPQSWACADSMGAALMNRPELVRDMVMAAKSSIRELGLEPKKTVSVKIRIHKDLRRTLDFIKMVESAGVDFITIHGRMKSTRSSHPVDLAAIKLLAESTTVPKLSNGDVFFLSDAERHVKETGVDGVMSARGLLQNPALFRGYDICPWAALDTFINLVVKHPIPFKLVQHHLSEMCGSDKSQTRDTLLTKQQRMTMIKCSNMIELIDFLDEIKELNRL